MDFTNFCHGFYKLLPCCSQTVVVTFVNFYRVVQTLAFILLVVHKLFEAMFTETFAMTAFVVMLL